MSVFQGENLDILEPDVSAVILQADMANPGVIFKSGVELVTGAIGSLAGNPEISQVDRIDAFPVESHDNAGARTGQHHPVPGPDRSEVVSDGGG